MRKPVGFFCICIKNGRDQLHGNRAFAFATQIVQPSTSLIQNFKSPAISVNGCGCTAPVGVGPDLKL